MVRPALSLRVELRTMPLTVMAATLLQPPCHEVETLVRNEVVANPALLLALHRNVSHAPGSFFRHLPATPTADHDDPLENVAAHPSQLDRLEEQVRLSLSGQLLALAVRVLHTLDSHGYLRTPRAELIRRWGVAPADLDQAIAAVQEMDPPGLAAADLRECLLIQCAQLAVEGRGCPDAARLLADAWDELARQNLAGAARRLRLPLSSVTSAAQFIARNLHPYPLSLVDGPDMVRPFTRPDLRIIRAEGPDGPRFSLEIPAADLFELRVSDEFRRLADRTRLTAAEQEWVSACVARAETFRAALDQRWRTLRRLGEYLMTVQRAFLEDGPAGLVPLTQAAVARAIGVHESTVSRAVSEKTVELPDGRIIALQTFFDTALPAREAIRDLLHERTGLSDREIAALLVERGYAIARRTVAKYRSQMQISAPPHARRNHRQGVAAVAQ